MQNLFEWILIFIGFSYPRENFIYLRNKIKSINLQLKIDRFFALAIFVYAFFSSTFTVPFLRTSPLLYLFVFIASPLTHCMISRWLSCHLIVSFQYMKLWRLTIAHYVVCLCDIKKTINKTEREDGNYFESKQRSEHVKKLGIYLTFLYICEPLKRINAACVSFTINSLVLFQFYWLVLFFSSSRFWSLHSSKAISLQLAIFYSRISLTFFRTLSTFFQLSLSFFSHLWGGGLQMRKAVNWHDTGCIEQTLWIYFHPFYF